MKSHTPYLVVALFAIGTTTFFSGCKNRDGASATSAQSQKNTLYRCSMHPDVRSEHPGECPICHMKLVKVENPVQNAEAAETAPKERKIKFYRNPMDPSIHSDKPMKDSMGMDYIPVYEDGEVAAGKGLEEIGRGAFSLSPEQMALSGTKIVTVEHRDLTLEIRVPGRVLGGSRVSFQAFEQDLAWIKPGMNFTAETPAAPGEKLAGKISFIYSILDPMTRTVRVDGSISRTGKAALRTEASLVGKLEIKIPGAVTIPEDAVIHLGSRNLVYVFDGKNGFSPREVLLGGKAQGFYEVKSGLEASEKISGGPNFLFDSESRIQYSYD